MSNTSNILTNSTSTSRLARDPYRDSNAGGVWQCGGLGKYGNSSTYNNAQACAACPPCTVNRASVLVADRDSNTFEASFDTDYAPCGSKRTLLNSFNGLGCVWPFATISTSAARRASPQDYLDQKLWSERWDKPDTF